MPPRPSDEYRRSLELFNEQAEILLHSRFAQTMFGSVTGITFSWEEGRPLEAKVTGPDAEAVRAFALTFRMFFRDGDGISFREMAALYEDASIPAALRNDYRWARKSINDFLDGPTAYEVNHERITRRRLVEVFMYGGLAHMNPGKRKDFELWRSNPVMFALMQNEFAVTLAEFFNHIRLVREVNLALMRGDESLASEPPDPSGREVAQ